MKKDTFEVLRRYYNTCLESFHPSEEALKTNICGFLNCLYVTDEIDEIEYSKIVQHLKKKTKLTIRVIK